MFLLHITDGCLLADRGLAIANDLDAPHGSVAFTGDNVNR